jgi:hypothetical protein
MPSQINAIKFSLKVMKSILISKKKMKQQRAIAKSLPIRFPPSNALLNSLEKILRIKRLTTTAGNGEWGFYFLLPLFPPA